MEEDIKKAVKTYQCIGCSLGGDTSCYEKAEYSEACGKHSPGTSLGLSVKFCLGMPKGFNRLGVALGEKPQTKIDLFRAFDDVWGEDGTPYDCWNIPVWKYVSKEGHTFVRGISPRNNAPFLHVILEDCINRIDCFEVSEIMVNQMD